MNVLLHMLEAIVVTIILVAMTMAILYGTYRLFAGRTIIEVCPRMQEGKYHAQFAGHPEMWSQGSSVADAVASLLQTHCRGGEPGVLPLDQDIEIKQLNVIR
jgi:hypothetical protein